MIFNKNAEVYATVWKATPSEKYIDLRISTSEKDQDGNYIDSGWFCRAIGHAANSLKNVEEKARIKITTYKLTNEYNKEKERSFFKFLILEAEILNNENKPEEEKKKDPAPAKKETKGKAQPASTDLPW